MAALTQNVSEQDDGFHVIISFGIAALLYLALVELFPESIEIAEEPEAPPWLRDVVMLSVFLGFLFIVVFETVIPEDTDV